jgi:hypothetical protein
MFNVFGHVQLTQQLKCENRSCKIKKQKKNAIPNFLSGQDAMQRVCIIIFFGQEDDNWPLPRNTDCFFYLMRARLSCPDSYFI